MEQNTGQEPCFGSGGFMRSCLQWAVGLLVLVGCFMSMPASPTSAPFSSSPTPETETEWETLAPGLEQRVYQPDGNFLGQLHVVRVDPAVYTFRAHYRPGDPLGIARWAETLSSPIAFVNANFFDPQAAILGLLVADGVVYGQSYQDRGGTFAKQNGIPRLRSNIQEPYQGETLEQAVQGFPMLVLNGEIAFSSTQGDQVTRRTVVAQDRSGRILLMMTPLIGISLTDLSAFLAEADMEIVNALNLDGGGSSMLYYRSPGVETPFTFPSLDPVPAVLAVYAR
jgi:uncharacterized protein YigE (DUF2233 family)